MSATTTRSTRAPPGMRAASAMVRSCLRRESIIIIAALLSLVSLNRLQAWVAMVIITRELAVTVLRLGATQAGVVIAASMFGKVKTCMQIAAILALIAVHGEPLWVSLLLYATVVVTVLSGLDYFFGLRRQMQQAHVRAPGST